MKLLFYCTKEIEVGDSPFYIIEGTLDDYITENIKLVSKIIANKNRKIIKDAKIFLGCYDSFQAASDEIERLKNGYYFRRELEYKNLFI